MTRGRQLLARLLLCATACGVLAAASLSACGGGSAPAGDADSAGQGRNGSVARESEAAADASRHDAEIARLEKQAEKSPGDDAARIALSEAYVRRADAFRRAAQYREAERDYQSALRHNPDNEEAQQGVADIAQQIGPDATGENGEPAPLPITPNATASDEEPSSPKATATTNASAPESKRREKQ